MRDPNQQSPLRAVMLVITLASLVVSGIAPFERGTWLLEVGPVLIALPILVATARSFPLSPLAYVLLAIHGLLLIIGGHYTYAKVPPGFWVQELLHLSRNPYDRLGHLAQGFIPAIVAREILLRRSPLRDCAQGPGSGWLFFLTTSICLAISSAYELVEWLAALIWHDGASAFLGTQGDEWDTQWDMFCALIGSIAAQLLFWRMHNRQVATMKTR